MSYRIVSFPGRGFVNPYIDLFYDALSIYGIDYAGEPVFDKRWLADNINTFEALHLHWPEVLWRNYSPSFIKKLRSTKITGSWRLSNILEKRLSGITFDTNLQWFKKHIDYLKSKNKDILLTWHNVVPHENVSVEDFAGYQILAEYVDIFIFHGSWAEQQCRKNYGVCSQKSIIMPHGNYDGVYPDPRDRTVIIHELNLDPEKPVVCMLGNIRNYKGIDTACKALALLDGSVQFLCAGNLHSSFDIEQLKQDVSKINRAVLIPQRISDQSFADYANLSEFILLPYKEVTGSGALLASLSMQRGVVASDLPYFRELLSETPEAGLLVEPGNPQALASAITNYLKVPGDIRSRAARNLANKYEWSKVVLPLVEAIQNRSSY